jgi:hypothetical protein
MTNLISNLHHNPEVNLKYPEMYISEYHIRYHHYKLMFRKNIQALHLQVALLDLRIV